MILDIIIILLVGFSAYRGYRKGALGIIISLVALILSFILGLTLKEPLANFLYESTNIGTSIEENVTLMLQKGVTSSMQNSEDIKAINGIISGTGTQISYLNSQMSHEITMLVLNILAFVIILILVYTICRLLQMLLNLFFNLPVISSLNKYGGAIINAGQTLLKILIILLVIYFVMPFQKTNSLSNLINSSIVTKALYENNFLVSIIQGSIKL